MHWKEIERFSRKLAEKLPSAVEVEKLKKHLRISLPNGLENRFQDEISEGKDVPFLNLYAEIIISWSIRNEGVNTASALVDLLSKFGVNCKDEPKTTFPVGSGERKIGSGECKTIQNKSTMSTIQFYPENEIEQHGLNRVYKGDFKRCDFEADAAIKMISYTRVKSPTSKEVETLTNISSAFLIKVFDIIWEGKFVYIAMELAQSHMEKWFEVNDPKTMSISKKLDYKAQILEFLQQVLYGLQALHSMKTPIIHRDLKPQNILICERGQGKVVAKISDFGISRFCEENGVITTHPQLGTSGWKPPEVLVEKGTAVPISVKYDMFPLGILIFYMVSNRKVLFSHKEESTGEETDNSIKANNPNWNQKISSVFHIREFRFLIEGLIRPSPETRISIPEVLRHPIFWDDHSKLGFLQCLSSDLKEIRGCGTFISQINEEFKRLPDWNSGWKQLLCVNVNKFLVSTHRQFPYDESLCTSLVHFIADKNRHYRSFPHYLLTEEVFGRKRELYMKYFLDRFVALVPMLYELCQKSTLPLPVKEFHPTLNILQ